jgi:hypothetical protein
VNTTGSAGGARTRPSTGNKGNLNADKNQWVIYYNDADGKINNIVLNSEEEAK